MKSKLIHNRSILKEQDLLKLFLEKLKEILKESMKQVIDEEIKGNCVYLYSTAFTQFSIDTISKLCKDYSLTFIISFSGKKLFICVTKNVLL